MFTQKLSMNGEEKFVVKIFHNHFSGLGTFMHVKLLIKETQLLLFFLIFEFFFNGMLSCV